MGLASIGGRFILPKISLCPKDTDWVGPIAGLDVVKPNISAPAGNPIANPRYPNQRNDSKFLRLEFT